MLERVELSYGNGSGNGEDKLEFQVIDWLNG